MDTMLPTARHRCNISSKRAVLPGAMTRRRALQTRYTLWRNSASTMEDLISTYGIASQSFAQR